MPIIVLFSFFFFNDTATTEIYTLSLHDALPISGPALDRRGRHLGHGTGHRHHGRGDRDPGDRKSTRLNSSHANISYAVFCLKKKKRSDLPRLLPHPVLLEPTLSVTHT